jgi:hypothetical protein
MKTCYLEKVLRMFLDVKFSIQVLFGDFWKTNFAACRFERAGAGATSTPIVNSMFHGGDSDLEPWGPQTSAPKWANLCSRFFSG